MLTDSCTVTQKLSTGFALLASRRKVPYFVGVSGETLRLLGKQNLGGRNSPPTDVRQPQPHERHQAEEDARGQQQARAGQRVTSARLDRGGERHHRQTPQGNKPPEQRDERGGDPTPVLMKGDHDEPGDEHHRPEDPGQNGVGE